ncbi:MAG TPA: hypothetical protein VGR28_04635 [Candidatus Thermoplasmatota archaeon]|jgi:hypothetical protein|nr:hypothetical protein [Candidatus Thermoplasmatota archaeon]
MAKQPPLTAEQRAMLDALGPFINVSAAAASLLMTLVGLLFFVPLWLAEGRAWTGGSVQGLWLLAPAMLVLLFASSRVGIRRQLRPLALVAAAVGAYVGGAPRVRGRLRRGWGATMEFEHELGLVRVVAARGQGTRPDLYLVVGEREYRFRERRAPLPEVPEALRTVGLTP